MSEHTAGGAAGSTV